MKWQAWAFVDDQCSVIADTSPHSEYGMWFLHVGCGNKEIEAAKARGCRVVRVTIDEIEE